MFRLLHDGGIDPEHLVHITPGDRSAPEPNLDLFPPTSSLSDHDVPFGMSSPHGRRLRPESLETY